MEQILSLLLQARNVAHVHHWKVKSFAQHLALGELYELLTKFADELAEMSIGDGSEIGVINHAEPNGFDRTDPKTFIQQLHEVLEGVKEILPQKDWLINKYEELQAAVAQVKYKLENLS